MTENEGLADDRRIEKMPNETCRGSLMAMLFNRCAPPECWIELLTDRMQAREMVR